MPIKVNVVQSRQKKVRVKVERAKWQQYLRY